MFFLFFFLAHTCIFQLLDKPWSQVSSLLPPGSCLHFFIAHRVQQSHCSSIFHLVLLLTHALALSVCMYVVVIVAVVVIITVIAQILFIETDDLRDRPEEIMPMIHRHIGETTRRACA